MATRKLKDDWDSYARGDREVSNNVWNKGDLVNGEDYRQTIAYDPADLTHDITFSWNWKVDTDNVLAYPELSVGYKPWDDSENKSDRSTIVSSEISDIKAFDLSHNISISGETENFNTAYDLWLTSKALGDNKTVTTELMVWAHAYTFDMDPASVVGKYVNDGVRYTIITYDDFGTLNSGDAWRYIALIPDKDALKTDIDMRDVLTELIDKGLVSESDFVTGYELGAEVVRGKGSVQINSATHTFATYNATADADRLTGDGGRDRLFGLLGADTLIGKGGEDFLSGGAGHDILTGGGGKDVFFFDLTGKNSDTITDFQSGKDMIELDSDFFSALSEGNLGKSAFKDGDAFGVKTRILYDASTGNLYYDADGSGSSDSAHLIATITHAPSLNHGDFSVV